MAECTEELRFKVTQDTHEMFLIYTQARGESFQDRLRILVEEFIEDEEHAHIKRTHLLKGKGIEPEPERKERGK